MQSYFDVVTDSGNRPIAGAEVFVYNYNGTLATIYSSADISTTVLSSAGTPYIVSQELLGPISNPITTGADGKYIFFAANGIYTIVITAANYDSRTLTIELNDPAPPPVVNVAFATNSSAPNTSTYAVSMTPSTLVANTDLVLQPKGDGALLAQVPDNTTAGGNKRGSNSVDWQTERGSADQVASGNISVISGGQENKASGVYSFVGGGLKNTASTSTAIVVGGNENIASGSASFVGGGAYNEAQALDTFVGGGFFNWANGTYASTVGGYFNTASGAYSFIGGGVSNAADSSYSVISGGGYGSTRGVVGYHAFPACIGPVAAVTGASQGGLLILGRVTTNATSAVLRSNTSASAGATNQIILPNNSAFYFRGSVIANVTGGGDTKSWTFDGQIKRGANAAATTLTGSTVTSPYGDAGASTWAVALSADTTNGGLSITVTGQASTTIRWVCKIETTEVSY
jgi:hypothetical protein